MSNLATIVNNILADSGIDDINVVVTNGSYSNPAWITALSWSKITSTPTTLSGYGITDAVPANRTITINGTAQDLSANRSWSVGTVTSVDMTVPTGFAISGRPITSSGTLALTFASGYSLPTTAVQSNWTTAYNDSIVSAAVTGTTTKTLTLTQQDGGTITASWTDYDTAPVTSVNAGTGISVNATTGAVTVTNTGVLSVNGSTGAVTGIITTSNYNSYSPTLTGGGASGNWGINITGNAATATTASSATQFNGLNFNGVTSRFQADLNTLGLASTSGIYNIGAGYTNGPAGDLYGTLFGIWNSDISVQFWATYNGHFYWRKSVGTTYTGSVWRTILDSVNYNSYAPTLTGTGASGTWGINVTGSSGSTGTLLLTGLGNGTVNVNNPNTAVYRNENGLGAAVAYAPLLHLGGGDTMWQIQGTYGSSGSGVLYFRQGYNGSWGTWLTMLSSSNYNNYSPTLTGGGASGTWGINVTGTAGSETLATVVSRGNTTGGGRPITLDTGGGAIITKADSGGWSMGTYYRGSGNTILAGFGAYGGGDALTWAWIGPGYEAPWMTINSGSTSINNSTTINGRLTLNTGGLNTYGIVSGYPNNNHLMTMRGQITGSTASPTVTGAHQMTFVEYAGADDTSGWYFKSSSTGTYEEVARITRTGINWNGNTVLHSGNYNSYAPTLTGGNASGTWGINITGNAATATTSTSSNYSNYLVSNSASVSSGFVSWNSYDDTTNNPFNSWWYGMRVSHGDALSYYSFTISSSFFSNGEVYYRRIQGGTSAGWVRFLDANNYGSYALPLSGGTVTGATIYTGTLFARKNQTSGDYTTAALWTESYGNTTTGIAFHISGVLGSFLEMRTNGILYWANNVVLHSGNYNSYSPTLTGGGASGTWGISISGNAATATNASQLGGISSSGFYREYGTIAPAGGLNGTSIGWTALDGYGAPVPNYPGGNQWWVGVWQGGNASRGIQIAGGYSDNELYFRKGADTWQSWRRVVTDVNYTDYTVTKTGGGASGTWGINVTGYSSYLPTVYAGGVQSNPQVYFGQSIGLKVAMTGVPFAWCDTLWINGYSGGDVLSMCALHTARNTQPRMWISAQNCNGSSYGTTYEFVTAWNSPYALNMNQYVRTTDAVSFASTNSTTFYNGRYSEWWCGDAVAPGPGANRYEVGRIGIDFNDWNGVGTFEVELQEIYYYAGGRKRYVISYGYGGPVISCSLVELNGVAAQGNFRVVVGPEVVVSGDWRYLPVYVEVQYYTQVAIKVRTTRNITASNVPEVGYAKVFTSPSGTGISGFSVDTTVYPTSGQADISNPVMRATSNLVTPTIYSGGGNVTFGNNIGLDGSNAQIQFNAAASADLYLSCIPGTRTMQIRNGNSGSPNYSACGLVTGTVDLTHYLQLSSDRVTQSNGHVGYFVSTQYTSTNYIPFSFESQYGTHSWGGVARFHIQQAGADRPSITFSSGSSNDRWSVGFCTGSDNNFRITQNMGMRPDGSGNNDGWGTQRMLINTSGNTTFSGTVTATAFFESSDRRIKDLIQDNYRVNDIESIRPKLYKKNGKIELGYYAQDVEPILSHAVSVNDDGFLNLSYREVHTAKIAYLEDSIEEIKAKILYLENQLKTKQ